MFEEFLSVTEAAQKLSVSPRTIQRYCREGRLNYKWVQGKRHKELRIIPPLSMTDLPGVQKKKILTAFDYVTQSDFEAIIQELHRHIQQRERRIEELEQEVGKLKKMVDSSSAKLSESEQSKRLQHIIHDLESVRPKETKLILKMAQELSKHEQFLISLGMEDTSAEGQE